MENITHVTKQGSKEFGLSNTNKLLKMATNFEVTGLKTGSTSIAKYCLSATAKKDGVELIAAIMAAPDYKARFKDAVTLLNYGMGTAGSIRTRRRRSFRSSRSTAEKNRKWNFPTGNLLHISGSTARIFPAWSGN